jgi:site-specific DNA-methyltransferase (adenine-specific)
MEFSFLEGDVIDMLRTLDESSVDCIVTSPPYNIGKNYGTSVNDRKPMKEYLQWIQCVFAECKRVMKPEASLFINIGYTSVEPWIAMDVAQALRSEFVLQNNITWVKNISIQENSYGHFKPINSKRFLNVTNETILHFTKTGDVAVERLAIGVPFVYKCNLKSRTNKDASLRPDVRCRGNTWFIPYETIQNKEQRGKHPASYPTALAEMCINLAMGEKKGVVLDPFVGTGTTLVACKNLCHSGIGIDINHEFLEFAKSRIQ